MECLITRDSKYMKATPVCHSWTVTEVPAIQGKKTDMLEDIIQQFEKNAKKRNLHMHTLANQERPADPNPVKCNSVIEKSYIETRPHPNNWQENDNDYIINVNQNNTIVIDRR